MELGLFIFGLFVLLLVRAWLTLDVEDEEEDECDRWDSIFNPWCPDYWIFNDD